MCTNHTHSLSGGWSSKLFKISLHRVVTEIGLKRLRAKDNSRAPLEDTDTVMYVYVQTLGTGFNS